MSQEIHALLASLKTMTHEEMASTLALLDELDARKRATLARNDFLAFIAALDPNYKFGAHLKRLGALLMDVEAGVQDRIAVSMAPRFGKSQMISIYYPAWYLGKHPDHKMIVASHTVDLAVDMARKVRNLMQTAGYKEIFPGVAIAADAKAAGKWNTTKGGEVYATGVGGALAGRGANLIVVDDPLSEQDIKSGNTSSLDGVYEWFRAGLRTRLMPGGALCVLHCLVGDTPITMGDGSVRLLQDIRPGDSVASYDCDHIRPAKVLLWATQGVDDVYTIAMQSGVILRGNERHPLLVNQNGVDTWIKIRDLQPGMNLVSVRDASDRPTAKQCGVCAKFVITLTYCVGKLQGGYTYLLRSVISPALQRVAPGWGSPKLSPVLVRLVNHVSGVVERILMPSGTPLGTTVSGKASYALRKDVGNQHMPKGSALSATAELTTPSEKLQGGSMTQMPAVTTTYRPSTVSLPLNMTLCGQPRTVRVPYASSLHTQVIRHLHGLCARWPLTTAMIRGGLGRYCATLATCWSKLVTPWTYSSGPLSTLTTTLDKIVSITPSGRAEVFDIQVEGTENFLANGIVSHNTRWHQRDLIGRLLKDTTLNEDGDQYEMFEFPAILELPNPAATLGHPEYSDTAPATIQKSLWPEQWSLESLLRTKASMPAWQWNAQYQQNPTAQEAAIIKKDHIKWWPKDDPPEVDFIVQSFDTALTTKTRSDYSVCQTWGVWKNSEGVDNVILLNCVKGKWEFPELKKMAIQQAKEWNPDSIIVEAKASGQPLIDEMRRSGLFVQDYSPGKGQDKIARVNSISDMFVSGQVWFPETRWATEVVDELLAFPAGEHDDLVDSLSLGLIRIRKGGLLRLSSDSEDNDGDHVPIRAAYY